MAKVRHTPGPGLRPLQAAIRGLGGATGKVGWFPSAKYEDGTPVALVAVVQEYGSTSKGIPPRPFLRPTQAARGEHWRRDAHVLSKAVIDGKVPPGAVMEGVTQKVEGDIRRTISKVLSPPLSEATIRGRKSRNAKGEASSKPLVDTGLMLNTLTSQVTKK